MKRVDLNCDLGESFGAYKIGLDGEVIPYISSANIACGFHASDPVVMAHTVAMAKEHGCSVGAHPGFPDLMGFGRRQMQITPEEAKDYIIYQVGALAAFCRSQGIRLHHVKPHGALYNMAAIDDSLARAVCEGIYVVDPELVLLGLAGSELLKAAEDTGLRYASEVFADRAYNGDGTLVSRKLPGAVITDEALAVQRVLRMVNEQKVTSITGEDITIRPDSICVHGDNQKALQFVQKIRDALIKEKIEIKPF
ncbi:LamB/YcsF family protein [Clostridium sp. AF15-31]|nr:LamB/YcsF family protein [Clostridium sp. AF15-31]